MGVSESVKSSVNFQYFIDVEEETTNKLLFCTIYLFSCFNLVTMLSQANSNISIYHTSE